MNTKEYVPLLNSYNEECRVLSLLRKITKNLHSDTNIVYPHKPSCSVMSLVTRFSNIYQFSVFITMLRGHLNVCNVAIVKHLG